MKRIISMILTLFFVGWGGYMADAQTDANAIWREAVRQSRKGNFHEAQKGFETLVKQGFHSADLYYNLGNTYAKQEAYPKAMLMYEKALKLDPGMDDSKENLRQLREDIDTDIVEIPPFFLTNWWRQWLGILSPNLWAALSLFLFVLLGWLFWLYLEKDRLDRRPMIILTAVLALIVTWSAYSSYKTRRSFDYAVVLPDTMPLYEGPDKRSSSETSVPPGIKVHIIDSIGAWYKVSLPDKQIGWMPDSAVVKI